MTTDQQPTEEELQSRKKELIQFYKEQLPLLKLQTEYVEYLTKIDVAKMTRLEIMMVKAQMMKPPTTSGEEVSQPDQEEHNIPQKPTKE